MKRLERVNVAEIVAKPSTFVVTFVEPNAFAPSPNPVGSHPTGFVTETPLEKKSSANVVDGVLSSVPWTVTDDPSNVTSSSSGKF